MRLVIVGIAPVRAGEEGQPLSALRKGATGRRLADLSGLRAMDFMDRTDRVNLVAEPRPSTIKVTDGRPMAEMLAGSMLRGRRVLLLGSNVAECFGVPRSAWDWLQWHECPDTGVFRLLGAAGFRAGSSGRLPFSWAVMPHPSGRCHWYSDPANRDAASRFLKIALDLCPRTGYKASPVTTETTDDPSDYPPGQAVRS